MGLVADFDSTLHALRRHDRVAAFLPTHLCMAIAVVLKAEGTGISLLSDIRVPLGWNGDAARAVEGAQTTIGSGPCLQAITDGRLVAANADSLPARWPDFAAFVNDRSPFRSVASLPLTFAGNLNGAVDIFWVDPNASSSLDLADVRDLAERISNLVLEDHTVEREEASGGSFDWLSGEGPRRRMQLWTALGLVSTELALETSAALAAIRAWATDRSLFLDDVVRRLVTGELSSKELLPSR